MHRQLLRHLPPELCIIEPSDHPSSMKSPFLFSMLLTILWSPCLIRQLSYFCYFNSYLGVLSSILDRKLLEVRDCVLNNSIFHTGFMQ